ncbi:MAG: purine-nucleoside phosphorylase [Parasporobacterium sp.]|nr:purine-nucleoside phosphorylase [Parasporobacterium sp.]
MMVPTPHNKGLKEDYSNVMLMPGDPMRSKYIAEEFLENAKLVNNLRGVQGYTGFWKGKRISVMSSGVGIPSISVYAYEMFNFYETDAIIHVGTAGSIQENVKVGEVLFAETAYTNSNFLKNFTLSKEYTPKPDPELLKTALEIAEEKGIRHHVGSVLTEEIYYSQEENIVQKWADRGVDAFEMEAAALYANAAQAGKKALALFTISNCILTGEEMDPDLRERALNEMIEIGLDTAWKEAK